jgi:hypothetical protein
MFPTWNLITELEMKDYIVKKVDIRYESYPLPGNMVLPSWKVYRKEDIDKNVVAVILKHGILQKPEIYIIKHRSTEEEKIVLRKIADKFVKKIIEA